MTQGQGQGRIIQSEDWTSLVETIHGGAALDDRPWLESIVNAARRFFVTTELSCTVVTHDPACSKARTEHVIASPRIGALPDWDDAGLGVLGIDLFRSVFYPARMVTTHDEIGRAFARPAREEFHEARMRLGMPGVLGMLTHPEPGVIVTIFATYSQPITPTPRERDALTRVALHLEAAYRLRRRGEEIVRAEIDMAGNVLHRSADAPDADALAAHVISVVKARSCGKVNGDDALGLWPALVSGQYSLIERKVLGQSRYLLIENAPASQLVRALTKLEIDVVSQAARGLSSKMIAYSLGLSSPTVSAGLASAASKVGAASRMDLVRLAAMFVRDPRARFDTSFALTDAERDVLELLRRGLSNDEIASIRSRSVRTIANQVAALLRKTKSRSRRELVLRTSDTDFAATVRDHQDPPS